MKTKIQSLVWLVVLFTASSLCAGLTKEQTAKYNAKLERRIVQSEEGGFGVVAILLDDGTLWDCYYYTSEGKQCLLYDWKPGSKVYFFRDEERIMMADKYYRCAFAYLDTNTADCLPYITQVTSNGICLSDGSEWSEKCWLFAVHNGWREGDRILIAHTRELTALGTHTLFNLSHANFGTLTSSSYMSATLVSLEP